MPLEIQFVCSPGRHFPDDESQILTVLNKVVDGQRISTDNREKKETKRHRLRERERESKRDRENESERKGED